MQQGHSQPIFDGWAPLLPKHIHKKQAHIHVRHYQKNVKSVCTLGL